MLRNKAILSLAVIALLASCGGDDGASPPTGFLAGTADNKEVAVVVNSTGKALTLFQVGAPTTQMQIPLGTSSTITPVGFSVRGRKAAVPLGNAASLALVDLQAGAATRFFTFASGNTTGSAWLNDTTIFVANSTTGKVGRVTIGQTGDAITSTVDVAAQPVAIAVAGSKVIVVSANLDANFLPLGNGKVSIIDPKTMTVTSTLTSGGTNSMDAAVGPDGLVYVVNTGDYVADGSITIIDPATAQVVTTVSGMGAGPGAIYIDGEGLAYISGYYTGTVVWNTKTRTFVRTATNSVCAKVNGTCRGAFGATVDSKGRLFQAFLGSSFDNQSPYVFMYDATTFALRDSVAVGVGPAAIVIRKF